jgi:hypothetical protein
MVLYVVQKVTSTKVIYIYINFYYLKSLLLNDHCAISARELKNKKMKWPHLMLYIVACMKVCYFVQKLLG